MSCKNEHPRAKGGSMLKSFVRYALGTGLLVLLVVYTDPSSVLSAFDDVSLGDLALLAAISFLLILVSVVKWQAFLLHLGISATVRRLFALYLLGYFVNLLMPSVLGGDVVRSLYVAKDADRARSVSATLLERYTGLMAMLLMAIIGVWWAPHVTESVKVVVVVVSAGAMVGSACLFSRTTTWILVWLKIPERFVLVVRRVEDGLVLGMQNKGLVVRALLLSFLFHILTVANTAAAGWAVGWESIPVGELFVVVPLILLVGAIPISPQGLGVQEGAFVFFLHSLGCTTGQALALALLLRAKSYVLALFGGLTWLMLRSLPQSVSQTGATPGAVSDR
jgi:uncharacterized protein (TIRG00374 family)